jgi:hypothetical protein
MKSGNRRAVKIFRSQFGARFAPMSAERQVGETVVHPSTSGCSKCPPQAAENRKIIGVSVWGRNALFSAGNGLAEMGNTLVQLKHSARAIAGDLECSGRI